MSAPSTLREGIARSALGFFKMIGDARREGTLDGLLFAVIMTFAATFFIVAGLLAGVSLGHVLIGAVLTGQWEAMAWGVGCTALFALVWWLGGLWADEEDDDADV